MPKCYQYWKDYIEKTVKKNNNNNIENTLTITMWWQLWYLRLCWKNIIVLHIVSMWNTELKERTLNTKKRREMSCMYMYFPGGHEGGAVTNYSSWSSVLPLDPWHLMLQPHPCLSVLIPVYYRNRQWIQQRDAVLMSEFKFKFLLSAVNTLISPKMHVLLISTQRPTQAVQESWMSREVYQLDRLALLLLLAAWVFLNIEGYLTFSVHRSNNMNLCMRQMLLEFCHQ